MTENQNGCTNFTANRWEALEAFLTFLKFSNSELASFVKILRCANYGFFNYKMNNIEITLEIIDGKELSEEDDYNLKLSFLKTINNVDFSADYYFELNELLVHFKHHF